MNEIINRWNEDLKLNYKKDILGATYYVSNIDAKIIDLKYLREINKKNIAKEFSVILTEIKGEFVHEKDSMCMGPHNNHCEDYYRCMLCILDYLLDVKRIKIIEGACSNE